MRREAALQYIIRETFGLLAPQTQTTKLFMPQVIILGLYALSVLLVIVEVRRYFGAYLRPKRNSSSCF
jgi:hypothetical protein